MESQNDCVTSGLSSGFWLLWGVLLLGLWDSQVKAGVTGVYLFICLFMAVFGLRCGIWALQSVGVDSIVGAHGLSMAHG